MFTLEDYAGKRGPLRDERGRYRRRTWDELGIFGRASAVLAKNTARQMTHALELYGSAKLVRVID